MIASAADRLAIAFDRYPFNSPWVRGIVGRYWLQAWFAIETVLALVQAAMDTRYIFFDARLYDAATRAWLAGEDPWQVQLAGNYFAAPPPTMLPLVPFAILPPEFGYLGIVLAVGIGAIASVRMLGLPWWWLLFPPLVQSVISGNVQSLLVPLILVGAGPIAALLKVYAAVPLLILGRWRSLLGLILVLLLTAPVLPWGSFIANLDEIGARLSSQNENGLPNLVLVLIAPLVVAALWVVGRERAAWLTVPAIWPAQQFYYGTLVMPTRNRIAAAIVAFPVAGAGTVALFVVAFLTWRKRARVAPLAPPAAGPRQDERVAPYAMLKSPRARQGLSERG